MLTGIAYFEILKTFLASIPFGYIFIHQNSIFISLTYLRYLKEVYCLQLVRICPHRILVTTITKYYLHITLVCTQKTYNHKKMGGENFNLKWNDHSTSLVGSAAQFFTTSQLTDVIIGTSGKTFKGNFYQE